MPPEPDQIVTVRDVRKRYGRTIALDGIDLEIQRGQRYAILGPNGAGKTTLNHMLCTILQPDSGSTSSAQPRPVPGRRGPLALVNQMAWPQWATASSRLPTPLPRASDLCPRTHTPPRTCLVERGVLPGVNPVSDARTARALGELTATSIREESLDFRQELGSTVVFVTCNPRLPRIGSAATAARWVDPRLWDASRVAIRTLRGRDEREC